MFTNRQKISLIISIWLYFVWIFVICALMRANFKGNFIGCVIVGGIGCVIVLLMYAIVFIDRYYISNKLKKPSNIKFIKSLRRSAYIKAIYIDIIGLFMLSLSALLVDSNEMHSLRLAWFIILSITVFITQILLFVTTYKKHFSAVRVLTLQEKNEELTLS